MNVLISGATGLVGTALAERLRARGDGVIPLSRSPGPAGARSVTWDPQADRIDAGPLEGIEYVVHLAGENIAQGRWNEAKKRRIRESRVKSTALLARVLASLAHKPKALVCASAIGYYGDRGSEVLTETSSPGTGYLPEVCNEWESAARPAADAGIRLVHLRIGVVLSAKGGALATMFTPFKMGVGGVLGPGTQYMSWIDLDDLVAIIVHALEDDGLSGAVNAVAPQPVTNHEFTKTLGSVLRRPTVFPMPAFAARLVFGEMADALLLSSARVEPKILTDQSFPFAYPTLAASLAHQLR